ncbi:MAG: energy transducer TonB, partial [Vicingaceae bacterium]|nr:energy transducer TonB [Vicingaceae bacterium]
KIKLLLLVSIIAVVGFATITFARKTTQNTTTINLSEKDSSDVVKNLSDFGIVGGINVDQRTGKATQFLGKKPALSYMVLRGVFRPNTILNTGRSITEKKLKNAQSIDQLIENYPSNWIHAYNSVTVSTNVNGKIIEEHGKNEKLTAEQKKLIENAQSVLLVVQYQKKNAAGEVQNRQMNVPLIVTPKTEAKYEGGYNQMITYLKENSLKEINAKNFTHLPQPSISFTINEDGTPESVALKASSRDDEIDQLLVKLIKSMPKWEPAINEAGENIKQEFVLNIGQDGC